MTAMTVSSVRAEPQSLSLRRRIQTLMGDLLALGFGVKLHSDPHKFAEFFRQVEGFDPASPLDPAYCHLDAQNFFWVQVLDARHTTIAFCAGKLIQAPMEAGGLPGLLREQRIFGDKATALWTPEIQVSGPAARLGGRLGYVGGGWVMPQRAPGKWGPGDSGHPGWRDRGLIGFCVQLVQLHLLAHFEADHLIGFVRPHHRPLAKSASGYSFRREVELAAPYYIGTGFAEPMWFVYSTRDDALEHLNGQERPVFRAEGMENIPGAPRPFALKNVG